MLRRHEAGHSWKAGALAIAVHAALLGAMLVSIDWKAAHPVLNVTEVELWDKLPAEKSASEVIPKPVIEPKPIEEKTEPKPEIKPALKIEPKLDKAQIEDPKVEIVLEKKKKKPEPKQPLQDKPILEKDNKEEQKKLAKAMREEDLQEKNIEKEAIKKEADALRKLQEELLSQDGEAKSAAKTKASSAANASVIGEYKAKIQAKIRGNVNKTLCEDIYAEPKFNISLLPTGELIGAPTLTKSSGSVACDEAVERAIYNSQPLPLPSDPNLFSSFRDLNLTFKPNE